MAKKFEVEEWLLPACVALVERQAPLTYAEAMKLGLDMTVLLSEAREKYIQQQQSGYSSHSPWGQQRSGSVFVDSWNRQSNKGTALLVKEILHIG